jgi:hypothetical protein
MFSFAHEFLTKLQSSKPLIEKITLMHQILAELELYLSQIVSFSRLWFLLNQSTQLQLINVMITTCFRFFQLFPFID